MLPFIKAVNRLKTLELDSSFIKKTSYKANDWELQDSNYWTEEWYLSYFCPWEETGHPKLLRESLMDMSLTLLLGALNPIRLLYLIN